MKAVILAGGLGTRLSEETSLRPKPMVEIGGMPILWHIMKIYSYHGIQDFIICCGYKGGFIKDYFKNYTLNNSDFTVSTMGGELKIHNRSVEDWNVTLVDTGFGTMTGGRLKRVKKYLENEEDFCFTYGDGVADINISELLKFHSAHQKLATVTSVRPSPRFGALITDGASVTNFSEKSKLNESLINGGFFVLKPDVIDLIDGDDTTWEQEPLTALATSGELMHYHHAGYWQPMDTLREKNELEALWASGQAPWKLW